MARRKIKRKCSIRDQQSLQLVGNNRKRRKCRKAKQSHTQCKRRKTHKYNLRRSNSVILVGETPCCQTPEQQEKYSKLGLNSALFLKGCQRPKRKQSHISIITISSDDEETSEERTSEWVNSLDENQQCSEEPEVLSISENCVSVANTTGDRMILRSSRRSLVKQDQTFQPSCASTPNTSANLQPPIQYQLANLCEAKESEFQLMDTSSGHQLEKYEFARECYCPFKEPSPGHRPEKCELAREFYCPFKEPSIGNQPEKCELAREFYCPFKEPSPGYQLEKCVFDRGFACPFKEPSTGNQPEKCEFDKGSDFTFKEPSSKNQTKNNASRTGNQPEKCELAEGSGNFHFHQGVESRFSFGFGSSSSSSSIFPSHPLNTENSGLENSKPVKERISKIPIFFFGGSSTRSTNVNISSVLPFQSQLNNCIDNSTSSARFTFPIEPNLNSNEGLLNNRIDNLTSSDGSVFQGEPNLNPEAKPSSNFNSNEVLLNNCMENSTSSGRFTLPNSQNSDHNQSS